MPSAVHHMWIDSVQFTIRGFFTDLSNSHVYFYKCVRKSELNLENSFWYYHENPLLIILEARKSYQIYEKIFLNYFMYVSTGKFYNTETYAYLKKEM